MAADDTTEALKAKQRALNLLERGEITKAEAMRLAGTKQRSNIEYWCKVAGIDAAAAREARLAQLWKTTKPR
jgi:hypothetical protein